MLEFIVFLRFLGVCLITNSHLGNVWPISQLATGGALGNSIFFFVSGYCISKTNQNFGKWIFKKIRKLYVPILMVQGACYLIGTYSYTDVLQTIKTCIWPTNYWFFPAILIGYICMYLESKLKEKGKSIFFVSCIGLILIRFYGAEIHKIGTENDFITKTAFYILLMQTGHSLRERPRKQNVKTWINVSKAAIGVLGMYGWKIGQNIGLVSSLLQPVEYLFLFCFVYNLFIVCRENENKLAKMALSKAWKPVRWIAAHSWEIYLVQVPLLHDLPLISFPFSLVEVVFAIFICSAAIHWGSSKIL